MNTYNEDVKMLEDDEITIDLGQLILVLWRKAWVMVLAGVLCGTIL